MRPWPRTTPGRGTRRCETSGPTSARCRRLRLVRGRPQLAVLATPSTAATDWLRAGQALQRFLLTATIRGIAASPLTQPLEIPDAWAGPDPRSGVEYPQMIMRFGDRLPVPAGTRADRFSEVLETPIAQYGQTQRTGATWQMRDVQEC